MPSKSDVTRFHDAHSDITKILPNGKLQFTQTGQDFAPNTSAAVLEAYVKGKAYRRALHAKENEAYDFEQHEPHIVGHKHKDKSHFLYCRLTGVTLPRMKHVIEGHVGGKKFQRRMKELQEQKEHKEKLRERKRAAKELARKRKAEGEMKDGEGDGAESDGGEDGDEENDVLDGIMSDGDGDGDSDGEDKDEEDSKENGHDVEMEEAEAEKRMQEDTKEEEGSVFWTRGKANRAAMVDSDEDDDDADEWGDAAQPKQKRKIKTKATKRQTETEPEPTSEQAAEESGTKRKLSDKKVTKKRRRPRQKRKVSESGT